MDKFKEKNPLSLRERQVLRMLAQGDEYSQMALLNKSNFC